ncbi:hypothetical protein [Paenibacillus aceti]|uniref:Helix-turn-helix domain-containing protein n=1 Tax=Paenibacillus aceti TaxID=1820010 RepID=A0ABQ1W1J2_9BACL|nr:hypothetical protein [Paenibacillus aceti]GGG06675.1 hypothetical protein GCM10010913_30640 [Paenibacillus aceti]
MTTVEARDQTRELIKAITEKEDNETLTLNARSLKSLVELMRDYAIITHASDPESEVTAAVESLIDYVDLNARSAAESTMYDSYKTTYLAEVFNVSVTAINNWIDEGRFINYQREPHKHARIPHFTPFQHRDRRIEPLGLIVERYRRQENKSFADDDERDMLVGQIELLKQKYGGKDFNDAFDCENLTNEQESDRSRWRFYMARLEELS